MREELRKCKTFKEFKLKCEIFNLKYIDCTKLFESIDKEGLLVDKERFLNVLIEETLKMNGVSQESSR